MRTPEERMALLAQVRANLARLDQCTGHDFAEPVGEPWVTAADGTSLYRKYRCVVCQGELGAVEKDWYEKGREHGRAERRS
jgi:hypothetical protein